MDRQARRPSAAQAGSLCSEAERDAKPKVSVIIATYNYSTVLHYAVASVLRQTFRDFELIVVGDCCTDDSEEVVRAFKDPRVRWLNLTENSGSKSIPQNAAIERARADLIAYLGHDDLWHPQHLAIVLEAIEESGADFAHSVAVYVPPPGETERHVSGIFPDHFRTGHVLVHSSVIHRKDVFDRIGMWPDYRVTQIPGDQLFWKRAGEAGLSFTAVPKLTVWKFNASSRPNSYVERKSDEQAHYFKLIEDDPNLTERELIDLVRSAMVHGLRPLEVYRVGRDAPPGAHIHLLLQIRGLAPMTPMEPLDFAPDLKPFRVEFAEPFPGKLRAGERIEIEVRIKNESEFEIASHPPAPVNFSYHWRDADGEITVFDGARTQLVPPLAAGASLHYFVVIHAPDVAGTFQLEPALVQESVRWFETPASDSRPLVEILPAK